MAPETGLTPWRAWLRRIAAIVALAVPVAMVVGALRVRLPRGAGLSQAARAVTLTTDNLGPLLRVVAGR